jgi:hypothetical protein
VFCLEAEAVQHKLHELRWRQAADLQLKIFPASLALSSVLAFPV